MQLTIHKYVNTSCAFLTDKTSEHIAYDLKQTTLNGLSLVVAAITFTFNLNLSLMPPLSAQSNSRFTTKHPFPVCAQWCMFSIVRANLKNMTFVARLFSALHRAILSHFSKPKNISKPCFFQCPVFLKNALLFKNIPCCLPIPRHIQKHFRKGLKSVQHYRSSWATTV